MAKARPGLCHRYPPTACIVGMKPGVGGAHPVTASIWPDVKAGDCCGEHTSLQAVQVVAMPPGDFFTGTPDTRKQ